MPLCIIHSMIYREENKVASKLGALLVLLVHRLLSLDINLESILERMDEETGFQMIVEVDYVWAVDHANQQTNPCIDRHVQTWIIPTERYLVIQICTEK